MASEPSPEDDKYLESLRNLLKISQEHRRNEEENNKSDDVTTDKTETSEIEIPEEQQLEPAVRVEPFKSMVEPEYVRKVIRQMDTMSSEQLKQALQRIKVSTGGNKKTLRKRVAQYYRKENALLNRKLEANTDKTYRYFDYLIATDFECTCVEIIYDYPHEIIELPAVLIDVREAKVISEFRTYVRPVRNPVLSDFCIDFTKIAQETVDKAPYFREALEKLYQWMRKFGLGEKGVRFAFVTDGPHDMWKFMQFQCLLSNIRMPHMFRNFINIKRTFKEKYDGLVKGNGKSGIENMLDKLKLSFIGNKHSGLDDARNIAQITIEMMRARVELRINQKCSWSEPPRYMIKDDDEEIGEDQDLQKMDVSRRDFQLWLRRLPLKLSTVNRREFVTEEYLDCESCAELADDKNDKEAFERKMAIREMLAKEDEDEFEELAKVHGHFKIGEIRPRPPPQPRENGDSDDSESDYDDYQREVEMLDIFGSQSSRSNATDVDLNSVWRESASASDGEHSSNLVSSQSTSAVATTLPTSSVADAAPIDSDSGDLISVMAPPPRNSLASSNRHNRNY